MEINSRENLRMTLEMDLVTIFMKMVINISGHMLVGNVKVLGRNKLLEVIFIWEDILMTLLKDGEL